MIGDAYSQGRPNALNAIRLILATGVILWHSYPLTGTPFTAGTPLAQLLGYGFVDGFFAVSGFLIVRSWIASPKASAFLSARALRILPAFWACLLVTALLAAPLSVMLSEAATPGVNWADAIAYVARNAALWIFQFGIEGTLTAVPYPDVWNGSLWTLAWEFLCYLAVLAFGLLGLWRRRWPVCAAFVAVWALAVADVSGITGSVLLENAVRFALVFLAGCVLAVFQDRVPLRWSLVAVAAAVIAASLWLPDYRILAAPAIAYLLIGVGGLISHPRLTLRNDISYGMYIYAFPVQQLLATAVGDSWGVVTFGLVATLATVPVAAASWFAVERPALRLKRRLRTGSARRLAAAA